MRKFTAFAMVMAVCMMVVFSFGCSDDDDNGGTTPVATELEKLVEYMTTNNLDLPAMMASWTITAQSLMDNGPENYFIMDIRTSDLYGPDSSGANGVVDFEDGHIAGAHKVAMADVVTYEAANNTTNLPVVVYCYTGHTAGHAVMALRLSGETDAKSMLWGFSAWNSDFDLWTNNTGNVALDYPDAWATTAPPDLPSNTGHPTLNTGEATGAAILAYQLNHAVLDGLNGITKTDVLSAYEDYHVICYWAEADWTHYGHITGAYQVTPGTLGLETLNILDPAGVNVIYCWSGQSASMVAAWLNVLGYDGRTLRYGANGMIYDDLETSKWSGSLDFDYVTGP
ncbi:MAG: rhodanese-like domain-containing protein [Candidatus Eisenbacteria bacterium]|uniref:Rhodanese-like domain-containing protein n=1 Tax=Eiseniibacteriota bacterium TaxID=2212470 RepID=A0A948W254_UNCEI|nr:rhodanese-like domain-containing protein [Candidatus Eisenbacteria bacterium]MBU1949416.1 rhodanese-like domain-containing protein [Candidatus Eisenbacteria bacterium]MBU2689572.1 rhodanese-like domain-containing protein [Candidatus Eisenbacteria bacterium]